MREADGGQWAVARPRAGPGTGAGGRHRCECAGASEQPRLQPHHHRVRTHATGRRVHSPREVHLSREQPKHFAAAAHVGAGQHAAHHGHGGHEAPVLVAADAGVEHVAGGEGVGGLGQRAQAGGGVRCGREGIRRVSMYMGSGGATPGTARTGSPPPGSECPARGVHSPLRSCHMRIPLCPCSAVSVHRTRVPLFGSVHSIRLPDCPC